MSGVPVIKKCIIKKLIYSRSKTYFSVTRKCLIGDSTGLTRHTVRPVKPRISRFFGRGLQWRGFRIMILHLEFGDFHVVKQISQAVFGFRIISTFLSFWLFWGCGLISRRGPSVSAFARIFIFTDGTVGWDWSLNLFSLLFGSLFFTGNGGGAFWGHSQTRFGSIWKRN